MGYRIQNVRFSKEGFLNWLNSKEYDQTVGTAQESTSCPVATYISERLNENKVYDELTVDVDGAALNVTGKPVNGKEFEFDAYSEEWIETFVNFVDELQGEVTAKKALELMNKVELYEKHPELVDTLDTLASYLNDMSKKDRAKALDDATEYLYSLAA